MNKLKPVAIAGACITPFGVKLNVQYLSRVKDGEKLYAIPDTHRVVSVELLRKALRCVDGSPYAGETTYQSLRAIIDNKGS